MLWTNSLWYLTVNGLWMMEMFLSLVSHMCSLDSHVPEKTTDESDSMDDGWGRRSSYLPYLRVYWWSESETTVDVVSWLASQSTSRSRLSFSVSLIFPFLTTSATSGRSYHYFSWSTVIFTCGMNWNDFVSISCALSSLLLIWQQESSRQQTTNLKAEMINANHEAGGRSYNTHFVWQLSFCVAFNAAAIIVIIITENECSIQ